MRYHYLLCHSDGTTVTSKRDYDSAQVALNHGKYFLSHSAAVSVLVKDSQGKYHMRYDKDATP